MGETSLSLIPQEEGKDWVEKTTALPCANLRLCGGVIGAPRDQKEIQLAGCTLQGVTERETHTEEPVGEREGMGSYRVISFFGAGYDSMELGTGQRRWRQPDWPKWGQGRKGNLSERHNGKLWQRRCTATWKT